jgi:hypothetical protein
LLVRKTHRRREVDFAIVAQRQCCFVKEAPGEDSRRASDAFSISSKSTKLSLDLIYVMLIQRFLRQRWMRFAVSQVTWLGSALIVGGAAVLGWFWWTLHEAATARQRAHE